MPAIRASARNVVIVRASHDVTRGAYDCVVRSGRREFPARFEADAYRALRLAHAAIMGYHGQSAPLSGLKIGVAAGFQDGATSVLTSASDLTIPSCPS